MTVLVTGAAGGIGSAIADSFKAMTSVVQQDARAADGVSIVGDLLDNTTLDSITALSEEGLDVVVAAHGIAGAGAISTITPDTVKHIVDVNTSSVLALYARVRQDLAARRGSFIVVSSQAGLVGEAGNAVYSASKFALVGWARAISRQPEAPRIRVVCPGMIETPLLVKAFEGNALDLGVTYEDVLNKRYKNVPLGRLGRPSEIARAVIWLSELQTTACVVAPITGGEILR